MSSNSSESFSYAMLAYTITGTVDRTISLPLNCWALCLIVSSKRLLQSEFLTINLVSMESAFSLCFFVSLVLNYFGTVNVLFYFSAAVVARALFQCHVCVDRYLAVAHPLIFIRYKRMRYRGACLAALWLAVVLAGLPSPAMLSDPLMVSLGSFLLLALTLVIELFCSFAILRILRRPGPGEKENKRKEGNRQKRRAIRIIWLTLAMLLLNVVPLLLLHVISRLGSRMDIMVTAFSFSNVGSSAQALLFLSRAGKLPCKG